MEPAPGDEPRVSDAVHRWAQANQPDNEYWLDTGADDPAASEVEESLTWAQSLGVGESGLQHQKYDDVRRLQWLPKSNRYLPPEGAWEANLGRESISHLSQYISEAIPTIDVERRVRNLDDLRNAWTNPSHEVPKWLRLGCNCDGSEWIGVLKQAGVDQRALTSLGSLRHQHGTFGTLEINRNIHRVLKEPPSGPLMNISGYLGSCVKESREALGNMRDWEPSVWHQSGHEFAPRFVGSKEWEWRTVVSASRTSHSEHTSSSRPSHTGLASRFQHGRTSEPFFRH